MTNRFNGVLLCGGLLLTVQLGTAQAAVPHVSGTYSVSMTQNCQAKATVASGKITISNAGNLMETIGTMVMTPKTATTGTAKGTTINATGNLIASSNPGHMQRTTEGGTGNYSVMANQIILPFLNGKTFDAVYSNIVGGIAHQVDFLGIDTSNGNGCNVRGTMTRQ